MICVAGTAIGTSFPVIHKNGNVVNFVLLGSGG